LIIVKINEIDQMLLHMLVRSALGSSQHVPIICANIIERSELERSRWTRV